MTTDLRVTSDVQGDWVVLRAEGEIDIASVETLQKEVDRAVDDGGQRIVFDLGEVSFMDSTGLRAIVTCHQRLSESGGGIAIVTGNGPVRRLLEVSGLEQSLPVYESVASAVES